LFFLFFLYDETPRNQSFGRLLLVWRHVVTYRERLSVLRQTPNLEDQVSVFITPGDRVIELYRQPLASIGLRESHFPYSQ
jgi:hypothetical protein